MIKIESSYGHVFLINVHNICYIQTGYNNMQYYWMNIVFKTSSTDCIVSFKTKEEREVQLNKLIREV